MKQIVFTGILFVSLFASAFAFANPPCPRDADRLEDFASCMVPYANGKGQVLVGSYASSGMDRHTAALMNSMHTTYDVPPQINPVIPAVSFVSNMATAAVASYKWRNNWGYNPYFYFWMMPYYRY